MKHPFKKNPCSRLLTLFKLLRLTVALLVAFECTRAGPGRPWRKTCGAHVKHKRTQKTTFDSSRRTSLYLERSGWVKRSVRHESSGLDFPISSRLTTRLAPFPDFHSTKFNKVRPLKSHFRWIYLRILQLINRYTQLSFFLKKIQLTLHIEKDCSRHAAWLKYVGCFQKENEQPAMG